MSIDWGEWQPFEGAPGRPLDEVEEETAERYFADLMEGRRRRIQELEGLLEHNGVQISFHDDGLQRLDEWYQAHVEGTTPDRLNDRWYAIGLDIGLYLGEAIIHRAPGVQWRLFTADKRDASFQRPVLMGFDKAPNRNYNVDPERLVGIHGHRLVAGDDEPRNFFVQLVNSAALRG